MNQSDEPRLRAVPGGDGESATDWLRRVGPKLRAAAEQGVVEDVRDLKRRLRTAALKADQVFDDAKAIVADLGVDGHSSACEAAKVALLRLKQAEAELERARERLMGS